MGSPLTGLFRMVLEASWQSSLVILLILLVRPLMGTAIPARWRYWLWMLVLIRLLVPIAAFPPSPVSMQNIAVVERPLGQMELVLPPAPPLPPMPPVPMHVPALRPEIPGIPITPSTPMPPPAAISPSPIKSSPVSWWAFASAIWIAGTLASFAIMIAAHVRLWRRLGENHAPVAPEVMAIWNACCARLRLRSVPVLRMSSEVVSPALVGLVRPVLLLPEGQPAAFSPADWENVFVHELAHYCRGDHWTHLLQLIALAAHWFNPMVWLGFRQLRADRELAADEWALQHLDPGKSGAYGDTLLKVLEQSSRPRLSLASVGILEDRLQLKQRLQRIVAFGPRTLFGSLAGLTIVIVMALLVLGRQMENEKIDLTYYDSLTPEQILVLAAQREDMPVVRQMLRNGVNINALGVPSERAAAMPAVGAAAAMGRLEAVTYLVSKGADVNLKTQWWPGPAQAAMMQGQTVCAQYLLDHGATCDPDILAAFHGDMTYLNQVTAKNPPDLKQLQLLCRIAAVNQQIAAYKLLIEKIHTIPAAYGWQLDGYAFFIVVKTGNRDMVQAVFDEGFNPKQFLGMPLARAASYHPGMDEWLRSKGERVSVYNDGEQLIDSAAVEDLPEMELMLKKGVDVNFRGESQWTPIVTAAEAGKVQAVKFLLAHGADPNSVERPGSDYSGLCLTRVPRIADMLYAAGADIYGPNYKSHGDEIMWYCVCWGPTAMVKWFLDHGVDPTKVGAGGDDGQTLLYSVNNPDIAELLIDHGVDVNHKTKDGTTALYWLCMYQKNPTEIVRVLLKHGADPNARTNYGETPLMVAPDGATVDVLVQYGADLKAKNNQGTGVLESVGFSSNGSRIEALIRHGVPFDPKTDGARILGQAISSNQNDLVAYLLDHGVDANAPVKFGYYKGKEFPGNALQEAVGRGNFDAARLLIDHGAKMNDALIVQALQENHGNIVQLLWEHGVRAISPLCYAVSQRAPVDQLQKILDQGSPVDPPQDKAVSPLAEAALLGNLDTVKFLVEHGANVNSGLPVDPDFPYRVSGPLRLAASQGHDTVVDFLLQHGAKPDFEALCIAANNSSSIMRDELIHVYFENTVKLLIDAGALKGLSEQDAARALEAGIFTNEGQGNQKVVQMMLDAGLSLDAHDAEGKTVIQKVRESASRTMYFDNPSKQMIAFLEQADQAKSPK